MKKRDIEMVQSTLSLALNLKSILFVEYTKPLIRVFPCRYVIIPNQEPLQFSGDYNARPTYRSIKWTKKNKFVKKWFFYCLHSALFRACRADLLSLLASLDTSINSVLAISASGDNSVSGCVAESAKAALAFTIERSQLIPEMVLASQTTVSKARDTKKEKNID